MRKYARPPVQRAGGLSAAYLEAADEEPQEEDGDYQDDLEQPLHDADSEVHSRCAQHLHQCTG